MRNVLLVLTAIVLFVSMSPDAHARLFRRRSNTTYVNRYDSPQAAANDKAHRMAANCRMTHLGGGYGGGRAEGIGQGGSAQQALNKCCFTGERALAASCVVQGRNGIYYACKIFW